MRPIYLIALLARVLIACGGDDCTECVTDEECEQACGVSMEGTNE